MAAATATARDLRVPLVAGPGTAVAAAAIAWTVRRDLRRACTAVRLGPPATRIAASIAPANPAARARSSGTLRLVALGDSSIAGIGAERLADCLAAQIAARVADATGRTVHVTGHGVSGARTADVARSQIPALDPDDPPDAVVVVVGANDIVHVTPPWRYASAVRQLYRALQDRVDRPVVACNLPEIRAITIVGRPLRDLAVVYGRLLGVAQRRALRRLPEVALVDARGAAGSAFLQRPEAMAADGFHPSDVGYALLADALAPAVIAAVTPATDHGPASHAR